MSKMSVWLLVASIAIAHPDLSDAAPDPVLAYGQARKAYDEGRYHVAHAKLQDAARHGHLPAHELLAFMYLHGQSLYPGVDRDRARAIRHFAKAADGGSATAALTLCTIEPMARSRVEVDRGCRARLAEGPRPADEVAAKVAATRR